MKSGIDKLYPTNLYIFSICNLTRLDIYVYFERGVWLDIYFDFRPLGCHRILMCGWCLIEIGLI